MIEELVQYFKTGEGELALALVLLLGLEPEQVDRTIKLSREKPLESEEEESEEEA